MELTEKTLSSAPAFEGRLLHLRIDSVQLPDGTTAQREIIEHPGGVGIVALTEAREVLLVQQYRHPYGSILTEIPAGKREPGEPPLLTGQRELAEETGYQAAHFTPLGTVYPTPGYCDEVIHLYMATGLQPIEAHPDADEFLHVLRRPLDTLVEQILAGEIPDAKTQIAVLKVHHLLTNTQEKGV
ncbi:MAG: NUDIX hydrolase [Clostridia bacterium]|nr:NUDIX hydrolase [Loktanella sp.]MBQ1950577.1 NUDIX hydrolase [Clostridia bacterium]